MKKILRFAMIVIMLLTISFLDFPSNVHAETGNVVGQDESITRIGWLHDLTVLFDMTVEEDNYPDNYFSDITPGDEYYRDAMVATEFGLVDVEAGYDLRPADPVTREFAAYTMNVCLGYVLDETDIYTFNDQDAFTHYGDKEIIENYYQAAQIAINHNWIALIDGSFAPQMNLTQAEKSAMWTDAQEHIKSQVIDNNYDNKVTFEKGVIEVPEGTEFQFEEYDTGTFVTLFNYYGNISEGDTFALWVNGLPAIYQAAAAENLGSGLVLQVTEGDESSAIQELDAQGIVEADLETAVQEGDGTMTWIAGGTETRNFEDGREITDPRAAGSVPIKAIKRSIPIKLSGGLSAQISVTIPKPTVNYKVNGIKEVYVALNADTAVSATIKGDMMDDLGLPSSIDIVYIPIGGVGEASISVSIAASGQCSANYNFNAVAGIHYTKNRGTSLVSSFKKKNFTISAQAELSATLSATLGVTKIPKVSASVWAKIGPRMGLSAWTYGDNKKPTTCMDTYGYVYAGAGATLKILSKDYSPRPYEIWTKNNSPVRVAAHYEDGVQTGTCTRGTSERRYYTRNSSKYFSDGSGIYNSAGGSGGGTVIQPRYEYSLSKNDKDEDVATITKYYGSVSAITIPNTIDGYPVVAVGKNAFKGNKYLMTVLLPNCITSIGNYAFAETNLMELELPSNLTYIGQEVLGGNKGVTEITIPKTLTGVGSSYSNILAGNGPFSNSNIQKATIEKGMTTIPEHLFHKNTTLNTVNIPDTVTTVERFAFAETGLTSIEVPDSITSLGSYVFAETKLIELRLPCNLVYIGQEVLKGNKGVTEITIPKTLTSVGSSYSNILAGNGPFSNSNIRKATIEKGMTTIPEHLFHKNATLNTVNIPDTVTTVERFAFAETGLASVEVPDSITSLGSCVFAETKLTELRLPCNLVYIGQEVLKGNKSVTEITIPNTLTSVGSSYSNILAGNGAFSNSNIRKATIEKGMTTIPEHLFHKNATLNSVNIPDTVTTVERFAFAETGLEGLKLPNSVNDILNHAFAASAITQIEIPNSVSSMGASIFRNCLNLESVILPNTRQNIMESMFEGCVSLKSITLPDTVTTIQSSAFSDCTSLSTISWSKSITQIMDSAFENCDSLVDLQVPGTVTTIGNSGFKDCDGLRKIVIPDSVTTLGPKIFYDCDALTDVSLGTGITALPVSCFEHCDILKSVALPYRVTKIESNAFKDSVAFKSITIPRTTSEIAASAFSYPAKLTIYGVPGTYAETFAKTQNISFVAKEINAVKATLSQTDLTLGKGGTVRLSLSVEPADFTDEVSWKSSSTDIVTITDAGLITAKAIGSTTIKVIAGDVSASCKVTVVQPVTSISLNKSSLTMEAMETYLLTASVYPNNAQNKEVVWSSSDTQIAAVDENGLVTALEKGTATITARAKDGSNVNKTCSVTVSNTVYMAASVADMESSHNYGNDCSDLWVYTSPEPAEMLRVIFDRQTEMEQDFDYIYIYSEDDTEIGKYTGRELAGTTVKVPGKTVKIKLVSDNAGTAWGFKVTDIVSSSTKLPQAITGTDNYNKTYGDDPFNLDSKITEGDGELTYAVDNKNVAGVDANGNVTILGAGTANITVTASATTDYTEVRKIVTLTVEKAQQQLEIHYEKDTMGIRQTVRIQGTSQTGSIRYQSDNEAVASVDTTGIVTGNSIGTVTIAVTSDGDENYLEAMEQIPLTVVETTELLTEISRCTLELDGTSFVSTGQKIEPVITVQDEDYTLMSGEDYIVYYTDNVNPGTATVNIFALAGSNYSGSVSTTFEIKPWLEEGATVIEPYAYSKSDNLVDVDIENTVAEIGERAFADCENLTSIYFYGNYPEMGQEVFANVTADAYYPYNDSSWALETLENYGGTINWIPWNPQTQEITKRDVALCQVSVEDVGYEYDGSEKTPNITVTDGFVTLEKGSDYIVAYTNNINAGTATVEVKGIDDYGGAFSMGFTIRQTMPILSFASESISKVYGDGGFNVVLQTSQTDGRITYSCDNTSVARVNGETGSVTIIGSGTARITANAARGVNYQPGEASYVLTVGKAANKINALNVKKTYSSKDQTVQIGAKAADGAALIYKSNSKAVRVNTAGLITITKKFIGKANITIKSSATRNYESASRTITVTVNPARVNLKKMTNASGGKAVVSWEKGENITGYELQYSTDKTLKKEVKKKIIKKAGTTRLTLSKLTKRRTYYMRMRSYKMVGKTKLYSGWSTIKGVKVNK